MIFYDFEVFKYDWLVCWLDTKTRKIYSLVNDKEKFEKFYEHYKNEIWVGYNSRNYDQWIAKAILCGFDPWAMNKWIIMENQKGYAYSKLLSRFPILNYDCSVGFRSLKELEAFMGHDIRETTVPFDIDRPLTKEEIEKTIFYCKHDVRECFEVFMETPQEFESHIGLIKEFDLPFSAISKTKAQISAMILGASKREWKDEFKISFPDTLDIGKYTEVTDFYKQWADTAEDYDGMKFSTTVCGVQHDYGIGGLHGAVRNYVGEGLFIMADVASYYPAMMIEYNWLSRNVSDPKKFRKIRDERIVMKAAKDPRQAPRKIVLNGTYGASKDKYNNLYDPLMANNICIGGQVLLTDLLDKLDGKCQLIQSNTDGILVKLFKPEDKDMVIGICKEWSKRTRMELEFDEYVKVIQKDVNNYIIIDKDGKCKRKGAYVKKLSPLDNDLPIVNEAVVNYFTKGVPVEKTIADCTELIKFQKVVKISGKYDYAWHNGNVLHEKVHRCFASLNPNDGMLMKKHKSKETLDKVGGTPEKCMIINENVLEMPIPDTLDREWYIKTAQERIDAFLGK